MPWSDSERLLNTRFLRIFADPVLIIDTGEQVMGSLNRRPMDGDRESDYYGVPVVNIVPMLLLDSGDAIRAPQGTRLRVRDVDYVVTDVNNTRDGLTRLQVQADG